MKRLVTASILSCVGAFVACAVEEPAPVTSDDGLGGTGMVQGGSAGVGVQGGTGNVPQGGSAGSGLVGGTAGSGAGGAMGGSAGDIGMGGSAGSGNVGGSSGDAGSGNVGGSSGDAGAGGMTGGNAGAGGMTGGNAGAGGMTGGNAGTGGMACPGPTELFPVAQVTGQTSGLTGTANPAGAMGSLEGHLIFTPCAPTACDDCGGDGWYYKGTRTPCSGGNLNAIQNFTVGGTPGQSYRVTLHFYGVVEPKNYGNQVTRQAGSMRPNQDAAGSTPPPWAYATGNPTYQGSDYNTYEIHIVDNNGMEVCSYFLNSDTSEGHWTYLLNYERTINVIGGGRVRVRVYDRNCRMIKNCMANGTQGPCNANGCNSKARSISQVSMASPPPPTGFPMGLDQPGLGEATNEAGQWLYIDVTNVQCGMPALGCNGM